MSRPRPESFLERVLLPAVLLFTAPAHAERTEIDLGSETVALERDADVTCTMQPTEVLERFRGYSLHCTRFDRTPLGWHSADDRPVWLVSSHAGESCPDGRLSGSYSIIEDATGREADRFIRPCFPPPKRPDGPPTYQVAIDPGVRCQISPDEVAKRYGWHGIVSMRCALAHAVQRLPQPTDARDRRIVWEVILDAAWQVIDDATGDLIAYTTFRPPISEGSGASPR